MESTKCPNAPQVVTDATAGRTVGAARPWADPSSHPGQMARAMSAMLREGARFLCRGPGFQISALEAHLLHMALQVAGYTSQPEPKTRGQAPHGEAKAPPWHFKPKCDGQLCKLTAQAYCRKGVCWKGLGMGEVANVDVGRSGSCAALPELNLPLSHRKRLALRVCQLLSEGSF